MRHAGRMIGAVLAGYLINAALVAATEWILPRIIANKYYFAVDLTTQCLYEIAAGYVCSFLAKLSGRRIAVVILILVGLLVGAISLTASWKTEPPWYGIALLLVWPPFVWLGHDLERRIALRNLTRQ